MLPADAEVAVNSDDAESDQEPSTIVEILTGQDEAVVEIDDDGASVSFVRLDADSHQYTPVAFSTPVAWAKTSPHLAAGAEPPVIAVVITMYNETCDELQLTLKALARCLKYICRKLGQDEFWKRIAVVIVSDGREMVAPSTWALLERLGLARPASMVQCSDSVVHLFESCPIFSDGNDPFPNMPLIVAIKEKNAGKINSHWWFFQGFCQILQPKYCVLFDVGTRPRSSSLYAFWKHFEADPTVAGVCGQITTRDGGLGLCIPVVGSQHFEYKIASVLDKSFESALGYMSVLPGAFSAYRYTAICGDPLAAYFSQLFVKDADLSPLIANMMLAEDRILCFQLIAKEGCDHVLRYLNSAVAETDVPHSLPILLKQRRRWLNGSFFALCYALSEYGMFHQQTTHTWMRKAAITYEFVYFLVSILMQWFSLGLFPLIIIFVLRALNFTNVGVGVFSVMYCAFIAIQFVLALKNDPVRLSCWYDASAAFIGALFLLLNGTILVISFRLIESGDPLILIAIFLSFGAYNLSALLHGELVTLVTSSLMYVFMMPTFLLILPIFAFCNVHDVSWGTKNINQSAFGADADERTKRLVRWRFQWFRVKLLTFWLSSNVAIAALSIYYNAGKLFLLAVLGILVFLNGSENVLHDRGCFDGFLISNLIVFCFLVLFPSNHTVSLVS